MPDEDTDYRYARFTDDERGGAETPDQSRVPAESGHGGGGGHGHGEEFEFGEVMVHQASQRLGHEGSNPSGVVFFCFGHTMARHFRRMALWLRCAPCSVPALVFMPPNPCPTAS